MITKDKLKEYIPHARQALSTFLETLLEEAPVVAVEEPRKQLRKPEELTNQIILFAAPPPVSTLIILPPEWLVPFSYAMLGEKVEELNDTTSDLIKELVGQAYDAIRNYLSAMDVELPPASFRFLTPEDMEDVEWTINTWEIVFSVTLSGEKYEGRIFLIAEPQSLEDHPSDASPSSTSDTPEHGAPASSVQVSRAQFQQFPDANGHTSPNASELPQNFDLLVDVEIEIRVELGKRRMPLVDILRMTVGTVIELDKLAGEPLEIYANGRLIAEGEAVVIDEQFGVRITRLAPNRLTERVSA